MRNEARRWVLLGLLVLLCGLVVPSRSGAYP
jgi:hypothetical protein